MLQPELSPLLVTGVAEGVSRATDLRQALDAITSELFRTVGTRAVIFERVDASWTPIAGVEAGRGASLAEDVPFRGTRVVRLGIAGAHTTALSLSNAADPDLLLMLDGDWTSSRDALTVWSLVLAHALADDPRTRLHAEVRTSPRARLRDGASTQPRGRCRHRGASRRHARRANPQGGTCLARALSQAGRMPRHRRDAWLSAGVGRRRSHQAGRVGHRPRLFVKAAGLRARRAVALDDDEEQQISTAPSRSRQCR